MERFGTNVVSHSPNSPRAFPGFSESSRPNRPLARLTSGSNEYHLALLGKRKGINFLYRIYLSVYIKTI